MKRKILFCLIVLTLFVLAFAPSCVPIDEPNQITVPYEVEFGVPRRGWNSGYNITCYYTSNEPQQDTEARAVIVTNYYFGGYGICGGYYGPFRNLYRPHDSVTMIIPLDGFIRWSKGEYTIYYSD